MSDQRVRIGQIQVDRLTMDQALVALERLVRERGGGAVFTPNVDHVVMADRWADFRDAYSRADLVLCDGQPLVWATRLLGAPVPEKVSGSDLFEPLMKRAAARGLRVFLLGAAPGVAEAGAQRLERELGVSIVGWDASRIGMAPSAEDDALIERIVAARPDIVTAFLGAPKSELWTDRARARLRPAVVVNLGASLDFYVGRVKRAPRWMRRVGLEWLFRLLQEPTRLARRYLVQDPLFLLILWRTMRERRTWRGRVMPTGSTGSIEPP